MAVTPRTETLTLRLTKADLARLQREAKAAGTPVSELVRERLLGKENRK